MPTVTIGSHKIELTHVDKILFPEDKIKKQELIDYYDKNSENVIRHMEGRPVSMHRFTEGIDKESFFHKEVPDYFPDWITRVSIKLKEGGTQKQLVCDSRATLVYLANQDCITPHIWLSKVDNLENPDRMIFDLDPSDEDFEKVREIAFILREVLENELELKSFVMTTGSRGVHIIVSLNQGSTFDAVRTFAHDIGRLTSLRHPEKATVEQRKEKRKKRVFIDTLRNAYGQTTVTPYAVRARPHAPIATPIEWDELKDKNLQPQTYTIQNIFRRLGQKDDLWKNINRHSYSLENREKHLRSLLEKEEE